MKGILKQMLLSLVVLLTVLVIVEAFRLVLLYRSVTAYKNYWIVGNQQALNPKSLHYIALGDSAAQGVGASSPEQGYVGLLAASLADKTAKPVQVTNLSVTGAKIQDVIDKQLPQLKNLQVNDRTVITLEIGANDLSAFDTATFTKVMGNLLSQLPPQTIVADVPYFGGGRYRAREGRAIEASEIIAQTAKKYGLAVAPLHQITQQKDSLLVYAADWFHPSNRGYRNWHQAFWQAIKL